MCMCVGCLYICVWGCMYVFGVYSMYTCVYVCVWGRMYLCMCVGVYVCVWGHMYVYGDVCRGVGMCVGVYVGVFTVYIDTRGQKETGSVKGNQ